MSLPSRNLESIAWAKDDSSSVNASAPPLYEATAPAVQRGRRGSDSGYSTLSDREREGSKQEKGAAAGISYTAEISLPLSLPSEKSTRWLPSFHSCLVSRIYTLELSLSLANGTIVPNTSLSLKVPIRIGVLATGERRGSGTGPPTPAPVAVSSPLNGSQIGESQSAEEDTRRVLPPGYEIFVGAGSGMAQRRRGGGGHAPTPANFSGSHIQTNDGEGDGINMVTGGQWTGGMAGLSAHGR